MTDHQSYSTLEVDNSKSIARKPLHTDLGKQVATEDGLEAVERAHTPVDSEKIGLSSHRKLAWPVVGAVLLITCLILGAVLGGVLGSRKKSNHSHSSTPSSTPSPVTVTPVSTSTIDFLQRKIAAVSYPTSDSNVTHLYYQDGEGILVQVTPATETNSWGVYQIGRYGKNNTALAAAVSRPGFPLQITLVFTDSDFLIHDLIFDPTSNLWNEGSLSEERYFTHPNSSLSTLYNQCRYCANTTLVVYQDVNGFVQVANMTASGWVLTQVNVNAVVGTGLAMQPQYLGSSGSSGMVADQINLYHQKETLNISLASWVPAPAASNGVSGWVTSNQIYLDGAPETPLAVASSYTNASSSPDWIQLLQLSDRGLGVSTWTTPSGWLQPQVYTPSAMSNSSANMKTYGDFAMTALGSAFAVVGLPDQPGNATIESWQMNDDLTDWTYTGVVANLSNWIV